MRVLFDSAVLIGAHLENIVMHKTGVFRYSEYLASHLKQLQDFKLTFYSALESKEMKVWESILHKDHKFKNTPTFNYLHPLKSKIEFISKKMEKVNPVHKLWLRGIKVSLKVLTRSNLNYSKGLQNFDLFYSPYYPIPKEIGCKKNLVCFTTIHDLVPLKYPQFFNINKKSFFDKILKNPPENHYFLTLSESTKADICHYYSIDPSRIFCIHGAASKELFYPIDDIKKIQSTLRKYRIQDPYILSLATIEPRKNIPFLVDTFIKMIKEDPDFPYVLVLAGAKGWEYKELLEKVKQYPGKIITTGYVQDSDLAALYSGATVFVYPSLYEGFGLPVLEAMQCKVPVIVSKSSSLPEIVADAGLYIDPTNSDELKNQLVKVCQNPGLRKELAEKAYDQAQKFSWQMCADKVLEAFEHGLRQVK